MSEKAFQSEATAMDEKKSGKKRAAAKLNK
jgi:hypothetical protein